MNVQEQFVAELCDSQNISFIGSINEQGFPTIRAMLRPRKCEGIHTIYFSTNTPTNKTNHFSANHKACVYFYDPLRFQGALLIGTVELLDTLADKQLLWLPGDELYYPDGVTDPNYCVIRFTTTSGRNYYNFQSVDFKIKN